MMAYIGSTSANFCWSWNSVHEVRGDPEQVQVVWFSGELPFTDWILIQIALKYYMLPCNTAALLINIFMILGAIIVERQKGQEMGTSVT
jgi:hypothetical protein